MDGHTNTKVCSTSLVERRQHCTYSNLDPRYRPLLPPPSLLEASKTHLAHQYAAAAELMYLSLYILSSQQLAASMVKHRTPKHHPHNTITTTALEEHHGASYSVCLSLDGISSRQRLPSPSTSLEVTSQTAPQRNFWRLLYAPIAGLPAASSTLGTRKSSANREIWRSTCC